MTPLSQLIQEAEKEFEKGFYTAQFYWFDADGKKYYENLSYNEPVPYDTAYQEVKKHIKEFPESGICYFFKNDDVKSLFTSYIKKGYELGGEKNLFI